MRQVGEHAFFSVSGLVFLQLPTGEYYIYLLCNIVTEKILYIYMYRESSSTSYIGQLGQNFQKPKFCCMVLLAGRFVAIFAEIHVFPSLCVCGPANSSDGAVRAAKRKMVGQASTCRVVRCVLRVYGRPGVCAACGEYSPRFVVCCVRVCCVPCVCAVCVCCRIGGCCCGLLWWESSLTRCHSWPAMVLKAQHAASCAQLWPDVTNANLAKLHVPLTFF